MVRKRSISTPKPPYKFQLLGISSPLKDYRLAWELNRSLKIDFSKKEYILSPKKENQEKTVIFYHEYKDSNNIYRLFQNKASHKKDSYLVSEMKSLDYIFYISGAEKDKMAELLLNCWKNADSVKGIILIKKLVPSKLKSIDNILW